MLQPMDADLDVVIDVEWTGISAGTERLLYTGRMPSFPGLGYPLIPGYETVGRVVQAGPQSGRTVGERVYLPGARCYQGDVRPLFGGTASRLVVRGDKAFPFAEPIGKQGTLFALAATAYHAGWGAGAATAPDLIVGHGALGRLLARLTVALGHPAPTVWETNPSRRDGAIGYQVIDPSEDSRRDYAAIYDVSGAQGLLDELVLRLRPQGEVVLAGFYEAPVAFAFPPAFMREARIRIAAEWKPADLTATIALANDRKLSLGGLITHEVVATDCASAYHTAFTDPACVKMILDWSTCA
jgi:3-hydroxyethyl bacteriochlorophyllide a dehydrogenase